MEDYALDIIIGKGPSARSVRLDLPPFTLVGATTRVGLLSAPLRDRFGVVSRLEYYTVDELSYISAGPLTFCRLRSSAKPPARSGCVPAVRHGSPTGC